MTCDGFDRVGPVEFILKNDTTGNPYKRTMYLFLKFLGRHPFYQTEYGCEVVDTFAMIKKQGDFSYNAESESYYILIPNYLPL